MKKRSKQRLEEVYNFAYTVLTYESETWKWSETVKLGNL